MVHNYIYSRDESQTRQQNVNHIVHLEQLFGGSMTYYRSGRNTQRYPPNAHIMRVDEIFCTSVTTVRRTSGGRGAVQIS